MTDKPTTVESHLACGHHISLLAISVESESRWCDLCETRKRLRDAEAMEGELRQRAEQMQGLLERLIRTLPDIVFEYAGAAMGWSNVSAIKAARDAAREGIRGK